MRVLLVGSGGREHALAWALAGSPLLQKLWAAPGNPGIAEVAECVPIPGGQLGRFGLRGNEPRRRRLQHSPPGATFVSSVEELAQGTEIVVCSLPDGAASEQVATAITRTAGRRTASVIDTSTIGVTAARSVDRLLSAAGMGYVDVPVSGGVAGARARTLSVMYAGSSSCATRSSRCSWDSATGDVAWRRGRPGTGAQAGQQFPFGRRVGRNQRGGVVLCLRGAGHRGRARGPQRGPADRARRPATSFPDTSSPGGTRLGSPIPSWRKISASTSKLPEQGPTRHGRSAAVTTSVWQRFAEEEPGAVSPGSTPSWRAPDPAGAAAVHGWPVVTLVRRTVAFVVVALAGATTSNSAQARRIGPAWASRLVVTEGGEWAWERSSSGQADWSSPKRGERHGPGRGRRPAPIDLSGPARYPQSSSTFRSGPLPR